MFKIGNYIYSNEFGIGIIVQDQSSDIGELLPYLACFNSDDRIITLLLDKNGQRWSNSNNCSKIENTPSNRILFNLDSVDKRMKSVIDNFKMVGENDVQEK